MDERGEITKKAPLPEAAVDCQRGADDGDDPARPGAAGLAETAAMGRAERWYFIINGIVIAGAGAALVWVLWWWPVG